MNLKKTVAVHYKYNHLGVSEGCDNNISNLWIRPTICKNVEKFKTILASHKKCVWRLTATTHVWLERWAGLVCMLTVVLKIRKKKVEFWEVTAHCLPQKLKSTFFWAFAGSVRSEVKNYKKTLILPTLLLQIFVIVLFLPFLELCALRGFIPSNILGLSWFRFLIRNKNYLHIINED